MVLQDESHFNAQANERCVMNECANQIGNSPQLDCRRAEPPPLPEEESYFIVRNNTRNKFMKNSGQHSHPLDLGKIERWRRRTMTHKKSPEEEHRERR